MSQYQHSILVGLLILAGFMFLHACDTQNDEITNLVFSHPSGIYESHIEVSIINPQSKDLVIRFTLDGSLPNANSNLYQKPISTSNTTTNNVSSIPTTLFPGSPRKWKPPSKQFDEGITIRAQVFQDKKALAKVYTQSDIIDSLANHTLPYTSIVTSPKHLFDDSTGILVPGHNHNLPNYEQRGKAWERPIHITWFDKNGDIVLEQSAGLRIHGGTSRQFPLKGLRVYAREEYGNSIFQYPLFETRNLEKYHRFLLRPSGHDFYLTFFRDAMMQSFAKNLSIDYSASQPVILYINGEYWGLINARERFDEYYILQHHGVENAYIADDSDSIYRTTIDLISRLNPVQDKDYKRIQEMIDIESFVDYKIFESFFYRWDLGNLKAWRPAAGKGKWKFVLSDFDVGMGGFWSVAQPEEFNFFEYILATDGPWNHLQGHNQNTERNTILLRKLLENDSFRQHFSSRYQYFLDEVFTEKKLMNAIDEFESQIESEIPDHIDRWGYPPSVEKWRECIVNLQDFATKRPAIVRQQLASTFAE